MSEGRVPQAIGVVSALLHEARGRGRGADAGADLVEYLAGEHVQHEPAAGRGVRRMLHRLHYELKLPVYCLLDNDPWGYYIYSVLKQGSINLAYESRRMAIPEARFLGLRSNDYVRCQLTPSVQIRLNEQDIKRAKQIAQYPWFAHKKPWQKEIDLMLRNGFKLEVEALISKDISYVTEQYVPARLEEGNFLD